MKTKILIIFIAASAFVLSQTRQDSTAAKSGKDKTVMQQNENQEKKENGNFKGDKEGMRRSKDVFIDKDGDGICDSRQGGMSFGKMRRRMGEGKSGPDGGGGGKGYGGRR